MAHNIALINMPFGQIQTANLALTQLKQRGGQESAGVRRRVLYLNHDFARYMGIELYGEILTGKQHPYSGLGDWLFREIALPDLPDDAKEYFAKYYPRRDATTRRVKQINLDKRRDYGLQYNSNQYAICADPDCKPGVNAAQTTRRSGIRGRARKGALLEP